MRTITGLPVRYQMQVEQLQYQLRQANDALKVLFYERDEADTRACVSEIKRLAAVGYNVGEYEVAELKAKTPEQRGLYLQHIMTKYERGPGVDMPPPLMGDPTPGPADNPNQPLSREEMDMALSMSKDSTDQNAFTQAIHYIRSNGGANRVGAFPNAQTGFDPSNPYNEPSANGNGY